uniref:Uncharacterized protein n=1 Tax=Arundo donax TaxID=35708 RepID=A0A0A9C4A6_ARUDO
MPVQHVCVIFLFHSFNFLLSSIGSLGLCYTTLVF